MGRKQCIFKLLRSLTFGSCHCTGLYLVFIGIIAFVTLFVTDSLYSYSQTEGSDSAWFLYLFYPRIW